MTEPTLESVLEELKKNLGEDAVEDILAEEEQVTGPIFKIGGVSTRQGAKRPELNPEKQARIEKTGEIGMALTPLGRGVGMAAQGIKNIGSNIVKGFTGSSRNVTRDLGGSGKFAAPGLGSKAGEAAGKAAANPTVQKGAAAAGVAAGVGAVASTADKDDKPEVKADTTSGPRKDMPGFKPSPEPSGDDLYKTPESEKNFPGKPGQTMTGKPPQPTPPSAPAAKEPPKPPAPPQRPQGNNIAGPPETGGNIAGPSAPARPSAPAKPAAPTTSATGPSGDESNAEYWNKEAERNRAAGGKPLPNEFNLFKEEANFDQFVKKFIKENR